MYVLNNVNEVKPYVARHKGILKSLNTNRNENWITRENNLSLIKWLKHHIFSELAINSVSISKD